jgi:HNH endonuclease/NUMOD3 motif
MDYRKLWESINGPVPVDELGRRYEIHHIDGNRENNELSNLKCVSIQEHFEIHKQQGDHGAAWLIAQRLKLSQADLENARRSHSESMRGMPGRMTGKHHSENAKAAISQKLKGVPKQPFTAEHRANISKAKKGSKQSEKARREKSERMKKEPSRFKTQSGGLNPNARKVLHVESGRVFETLSQAAEEFKCTVSNIGNLAKRGTRFRYL